MIDKDFLKATSFLGSKNLGSNPEKLVRDISSCSFK